MSKQWNKDIHDRLKDFPKKAPEGLLDDIKSEMLRRGLNTTPASNVSRPLYPAVIRWGAAVAAMLLLLFGLSYEWTRRTEPPIIYPTIAEIRGINNEPITGALDSISGKKVKTVPAKATRQKQAIADLYIPITDTLYTIKVDSLPQDKSSEKEKQETEEITNPAPKCKTETYQRNLLAYTPKRKSSSLTAGIYYSGVLAQGNLDFLKNENYLYNDVPQQSTDTPGNLANNGNPLDHTSLEEKERHHLPIQFGLSLRYNINQRWSIQSGLTYRYLASDLSKSNQRISYQTKQKLHYVGIPLQAGYQIGTIHKFKGYLTAGAQVEKLISGKATTDYSVNNQHQSTSTDDISDNRLLFSALASIGFEYALGKDFSLYAEPGIHYYFKNGNGLKTHYNEQPLNFNITVGFRFHWNK